MVGRFCFASLALVSLSGCGIAVPEIQDLGGRVQNEQFVQALITNIKCELRDAVSGLHKQFPQGTFIDGYGIQTTLTLTYDEKGSLSPGFSAVPNLATPIFSLAGGVGLSSEANRKDTIDGYYLVSDLENTRCSESSRPNGMFLLQSDLKLSEWLFTAVIAQSTGVVNFDATSKAAKDSILQHEIKFTIETSGNITPTWKLKHFTINPGINFLSLDRTRTNDLIITLGPAAKAVVAAKTKPGGKVLAAREPSERASNLHLSATIANSISTAVRQALQP